MGVVNVLLVCTVDAAAVAHAAVGVLFVVGAHRRVCWFVTPVPLFDEVTIVGPIAVCADGTRLSAVAIAPAQRHCEDAP